MLRKSVSVVVFLMALGAAGAALAVQSTNAETSALSGVTVSVANAVSSVEAKEQGKVVELALAGSPSKPIYNVTVQLPDGTETNFTVDAKTGTVASGSDVADNQGNGAEQGEQEDGGNDNGESGESGSN